MAIRRSIADICKALAESAAHQGHQLLSHLLSVATLEAIQRKATYSEMPAGADIKELLVGAWDWDIKTDLVYADHKVASYFGLDPEEAYRGTPIRHWLDAIHPSDRARTSEAIQQAMKTCDVFMVEYRVMTTNGLRWVFARGKCICDENNVPLRFPGALIDITHEKADFPEVHDAPN